MYRVLKKIFSQMKMGWKIICITLLSLIFIEFVLSSFYRDMLVARMYQEMSKADTYVNADWVKSYYEELSESFRREWKSYVGWQNAPYQGRYINVDNKGMRKTWNSEKNINDLKRLKVFMFGGSTMWGYGERDEFTIPSIFSKKLHEHGIDAEVFNFGENAYQSTQELIILINELKNNNYPDLVIFYDGFNDMYTAVDLGVAGVLSKKQCRFPSGTYNTKKEDLENRKWTLSIDDVYLKRLISDALSHMNLGKKNKTVESKILEARDKKLSNDILRTYQANVEIVKSLKNHYSFDVLFYWQPTLYDKKYLSKYERSYMENNPFVSKYKNVHDLIQENLKRSAWVESNSDIFHDIRLIFSENREPLFIDLVHLDQRGNKYIAEQMFNDALLVMGENASHNLLKPNS